MRVLPLLNLEVVLSKSGKTRTCSCGLDSFVVDAIQPRPIRAGAQQPARDTPKRRPVQADVSGHFVSAAEWPWMFSFKFRMFFRKLASMKHHVITMLVNIAHVRRTS